MSVGDGNVGSETSSASAPGAARPSMDGASSQNSPFHSSSLKPGGVRPGSRRHVQLEQKSSTGSSYKVSRIAMQHTPNNPNQGADPSHARVTSDAHKEGNRPELAKVECKLAMLEDNGQVEFFHFRNVFMHEYGAAMRAKAHPHWEPWQITQRS